MNARIAWATTVSWLVFVTAGHPTELVFGQEIDEPIPNSVSDESVLEKLQRAKLEITSEAVHLRYKYKTGEVIRWKVVHLATTDTTIKKETETSKTRSVAVKAWKVIAADATGKATLQHIVEEVDMWQKVSSRPEIRYNSRNDETPPPEYFTVAQTIGVPLLTAQVTSTGQITKRDRPKKNFDLGLGQMTIPFPAQPIAPGKSWYVPSQIAVQLSSGQIRQLKIRKKYTLEHIKTGVATIRVRTERITPVNDPRIEAQLMQDLVDGVIRFDLDAGRMISRQVDWDETVIEFAGASSMIKYRARLTETLIPQTTHTADASGS